MAFEKLRTMAFILLLRVPRPSLLGRGFSSRWNASMVRRTGGQAFVDDIERARGAPPFSAFFAERAGGKTLSL